MYFDVVNKCVPQEKLVASWNRNPSVLPDPEGGILIVASAFSNTVLNWMNHHFTFLLCHTQLLCTLGCPSNSVVCN